MKHLLFAAQRLQDAGVATIGVDLFINTLPTDVPRGIMLKDPLDPITIDEGMEGFYTTSFQTIIRDPDLEAADTRAWAALNALRCYRVDGGDIFISWLRPATLPMSYPRGDADDIETSVRYDIGFGIKA